ncbi:MAG TPA: M17 family peptidase N-terminal domain-containing protein, partial [Syntrophales bacterium]|nr:M17 family peptidase N-terminal domain-containing protein [Syntrophales bacterium]
MEFIVKEGKAAEFATEALIVPHFEKEKQLLEGAKYLDEKLGGLIKEVIDGGDFEGKLNQIAVIYTRGAIPAKRVVLTGLGKKGDVDMEKLRGAFSKSAQQI